jgi:hypothetical protein
MGTLLKNNCATAIPEFASEQKKSTVSPCLAFSSSVSGRPNVSEA